MTRSPLPKPLSDYVRRFVARRRMIGLVRAGGWGICFALLWLVLACSLDRMFQLHAYLRLALLIIGGGGFAGILLRPLRRALRRRIDWLEAAAEIEASNPAFAQRLQTVVSQFIDNPAYRGSAQMLDRLVAEVTEQAVHDQPDRALPRRRFVAPWLAAAGAAVVFAGLSRFPTLGLQPLLTRFVRPFASLPPVTTTRLTVSPGNTSVDVGSPLVIRARAQRLGTGAVDLFTSQNGKTWTRLAMNLAGDGEFSFIYPSLDRDLFYYLKAGDAVTDTFKAAALRPPAVLEFRIRCDYPAYTERPPQILTSTDGLIEALTGARLTLTLVASEPLKSAVLAFGAEKIALSATAQPHIFCSELIVRKSQNADLEMLSVAGRSTKAPNALTIRALLDRDPVARIIRPAEDLRLQPRDPLPIQYEVTDDFGIVSLLLSVQVNAASPVELPIKRQGDLHGQEGQFLLELASLNVRVGDVVRVLVAAQDSAGHKATSNAVQVLVSPRSIGLDAHLRLAELRTAAQFAQNTLDELQRAGDTLERLRRRAQPSEAEFLSDRLKLSRALAGAAEAALVAHQSLLRADLRAESPAQAQAVGWCVDRARRLLWHADRLSTGDAAGASEDALAERLRSAMDSARNLAGSTKTVADGQLAAATLADRGNLRMPLTSLPTDRAVADRLRETLRQGEQDLAAQVELLGLRAGAGDLDNQLQRRVEAAAQLAQSAPFMALENLAGEWIAALRRNDPEPPPFPERLLSASAAEALRPDSNPQMARDLQLIARAAVAAQAGRGGEFTSAATRPTIDLDDFPRAVAALQREHRLARGASELRVSEVAAIRKAAASARSNLAEWATQTDLALLDPEHSVEPEDLALAATVKTARRSYSAAGALDQRLARAQKAATAEARAGLDAVQQAMNLLQDIDRAAAGQRAIQTQTAAPGARQQSARLAEAQQQLAELLARIDAANDDADDAARSQPGSLQLAIATLQLAHDQLALMLEPAPQPAPPARAATAAPQVAEQLARQLAPFEPEAHEAAVAIREQVVPALRSLQQAAQNRDGGGQERATAALRRAIDAAQSAIQQARARLIERDPLLAARFFAQAAAGALSGQPPDFVTARAHQQHAASAIDRAWTTSLHRAALQRLALTPTFRPLLNIQAPETSRNKSPRSITALLPSLRQWGFLHQRQSTPLSPTQPDSDYPAYQDPLRLYFNALNRVQEQTEKKN